jgi:hypothetical protein
MGGLMFGRYGCQLVLPFSLRRITVLIAALKDFSHIMPTSVRPDPAGNRTQTIAASRTMQSRLRAAFF